MITTALPSLEAWTAHFAQAPVPVLPRTADAMDWLKDRQDDLDAHRIAEFLAGDPLMTLKILGKRIKWLILPLHESETDRHLIGLSG